MAIQIVGVDDALPGACTDVGIVYDGSSTLTSTKIIAGTSMTLSGTAAITGNVAVNTDKFTVDATNGNTVIAGTLTVAGGTVSPDGEAVTLDAGKDLIGSSTSDIIINTDKFTVAGATGDTDVGGKLEIVGETIHQSRIIGGAETDIELNTDKFTVDATNGNTVIAGTLTVDGSPVTPNGGTVTLGAGEDLIGSSTSDITFNTDKFTVAGATGNTAIGGTLNITGDTTHTGTIVGGAETDIALNTDKFSVDATNGNTVIAGTLTVGGVPVPSGGGGSISTTEALFTYTVAQNTPGGTYSSANTWQDRPINTEVHNDISGCSLTSNVLTLAAGTYMIYCKTWCNAEMITVRMFDGTTALVENIIRLPYSILLPNILFGTFTLAAETTMTVQMRGTAGTATTGMGWPENISGHNESYLELNITKFG